MLRRQQRKGERDGAAEIYDDYAHHPTEVAATLEALRELAPRAADRGLPAAPLLAHQGARRRASARRSRPPTRSACSTSTRPASSRSGELAGVSGLDVARAAADHAGGRPVCGCAISTPAGGPRGRLREGDLLVTIGAGDVLARLCRRAGSAARRTSGRTKPSPAAGEAAEMSVPAGVERDYPLARLTTVRAGGAAELFARPRPRTSWSSCSPGRPPRASRSRSSARARTCWSPTTASRGLVLKLAGELAEIERDGTRVVCGGGVRLPSAAAKVAGWGLAGLEFGINIPGTVGGAVRMNANAYGGQLASVLEWVDVCTAAGAERRRPEELGFAYRRSSLRAGRGRLAARRSRSPTPTRRRSRRRSPRCAASAARPSRRGSRPSARPSRTPTTRPRRAAGPPASCSRRPAARGLEVGGARLSPKHANFVENTGTATTADVLAVMAAGAPPGPRALRGRARARGPGPRRGSSGRDWEL